MTNGGALRGASRSPGHPGAEEEHEAIEGRQAPPLLRGGCGQPPAKRPWVRCEGGMMIYGYTALYTMGGNRGLGAWGRLPYSATGGQDGMAVGRGAAGGGIAGDAEAGGDDVHHPEEPRGQVVAHRPGGHLAKGGGPRRGGSGPIPGGGEVSR